MLAENKPINQRFPNMETIKHSNICNYSAVVDECIFCLPQHQKLFLKVQGFITQNNLRKC